jgi:hypothetical protein
VDSHYEYKGSNFSGDAHRAFVGGLWDELGQFQLDFMVNNGLEPKHSLIDVGCGSLRGGCRFIDYLSPHHYFGTDINAALIERGIACELTDEQRSRISDDSFIVSDDFNFDFDIRSFDFGIALSLFTHLSQNKIRLCLNNLRPKFDGGRFFATFFVTTEDDYARPCSQKDGITTWHWKDPYHYKIGHIEEMAKDCGWNFEWMGDIGHPRNQMMACFS